MAFNNIPPNGFPALPDVEDLEAVKKDVTDLNAQKANQITIAPFFNSESSYNVGDLVYYNGLSYRCTNAHEGEWDADDFAPTTIANELDTLKSGLTGQIITYENVTIAAGSKTWVANLAQNKVCCVYAKHSEIMVYLAEAIDSASLQVYARNFGNDSITTTIYLKEIG